MNQGMLYDKDEVIQALKDNSGIMKHAAKQVGCTRQTIARYVKQDEDIRRAKEESKEELVDEAENSLKELMMECTNERVKLKALIFFLSTQAKSRGYVKKIQNEFQANVREILDNVFPKIDNDTEFSDDDIPGLNGPDQLPEN